MTYFKDEILLVFKDQKRLQKVKSLIKDQMLNAAVQSVNSFDQAVEIYVNKVKIDLVIIDSFSEDINALELLKKLKRINPKTGILIISEEITKELSLQVLNDGAYNLLSFEGSVDALLNNIRSYFHGIQNDRLNIEIIQFLKEGKITYEIPNSLKYIPVVSHHLTRDLAQVGLVSEEKVDNIKFGIQEILINAIEHGNLEISFEEKSKMLKKRLEISKIIDKYSKQKEFVNRKVRIDFTLTKEKAEYMITDEGKGFDQKILEKEPNNDDLFLEHGRGISMAKKYFDEFYFNAKGNQVTMIIFKK